LFAASVESGFAVGIEESKNNDKGEIQGSFAPLRMTASLSINTASLPIRKQP
jgi:hypothetical protein